MKNSVVTEFEGIDVPEYDFKLEITLSGNEWGCITAALNTLARVNPDPDYAARLVALRNHIMERVVTNGPEMGPES